MVIMPNEAHAYESAAESLKYRPAMGKAKRKAINQLPMMTLK